MKPFRYVQSFVDRKTGAVFHYFRRRGYPRIRLPGLLGSREFMEAYQRALDSQQMPIGASRTKAGPSTRLLSATTTRRCSSDHWHRVRKQCAAAS
jgi:hypothetical protein